MARKTKPPTTKRSPTAFLSYVREDDQFERITQFREHLSREVRSQIGDDFPIFQDRNDILWGQNWKERIEDSLDEVTFFIPTITPSFFNSPACRGELARFLEREKKLKRNDLILPLYYVDCPLLNDEARRAKDPLAQAIAKHQWADWRDLRFEPFTTTEVGKRLEQLARQIRDALDRLATSGKAKVKPTASRKRVRPPKAIRAQVGGRSTLELEAAESASERISPRRGPSARTEPPTHVVDPLGRGDHTTISETIQAANPGDRILVRPGLYQEGIIIDKPLEIIGEGDLSDIVIQATRQDALLFQTTMGRVTNLTLRQMGGGSWSGVNIAQGRLELEGCDITSESFACVAIHAGADPRLRRNRIHGGKAMGVSIFDHGLGLIEDNDIIGNALSGVTIMTGGNPTLRHNRIHDGGGSGVSVSDSGRGTLEDNEIFSNTDAEVAITKMGDLILRRNRIHNSKGTGVIIWRNGRGTLEDNEILGNAAAGVEIAIGSNVMLRRNRVNRNGLVAVGIHGGSGGTFEDNDLRDNAGGAWDISSDSEPNVKRARNLE